MSRSIFMPDIITTDHKQYPDYRGYFMETYRQDWGEPYVQDNQSGSRKGVIRGLHYQLSPFVQSKIVRVIEGEIFDVAVDLRKSSPNFGKWHGEFLSNGMFKSLVIPGGFAHGFQVLSEYAVILYKVSNYWNKLSERTLLWDDPDIGIEWQVLKYIEPIVSEKDKQGKSFREADYFE